MSQKNPAVGTKSSLWTDTHSVRETNYTVTKKLHSCRLISH